MVIELEIPQFTVDNGIQFQWQENFEIQTKVDNGIINVVANKAGLVSLANHLLNLAQEDVPSGYHIHLDEFNSLEAGSNELIIQKI